MLSCKAWARAIINIVPSYFNNNVVEKGKFILESGVSVTEI